MSQPRLLDLFCGAGGAAVGYRRAGFTEIVGVDNRPQPRYPFTFVLGDALEYVKAHGHEYDAIHASPPCQHYANVTAWRGTPADHPALIAPTRVVLQMIGRPWVMENVRTRALYATLMLCGTHFGLRVRRHRYFASSVPIGLTTSCAHNGELPFEHKGERAYADAMGCQWMTNREAREAVPPAYCEFIGTQLLHALRSA